MIFHLKSYLPEECADEYIRQLRSTERLVLKFNGSNFVRRAYYRLMVYFADRKLQRLGYKYNLDIGLFSCKEGLKIWHIAGGVVINMNARIGENLTLHGCNCIGNDGIHPKIAPRIGNNVHLGFGASVIGDVTLADNIWVAAGAVVVTSFFESGIVIGGVPARKIKNIQDN